MLDSIQRGFYAEFEKRAVSVARTLAVLRNRMAQGAAVAPGILADIERGAGAARTPAMARRIALNAGDDVRLHQGMRRAISNPVTQASRDRLIQGYESAVRRDPGVFNPTKPLAPHYDHGPAGMTPKPIAYARVHADSLAGASQLQDPKGLLRAPSRIERKSLGTAVTAVDTPSARKVM